ncbi:type II secretion system minor pseudopilin GspK [Thalassotalea aquiviva]|uniref:type II secretion system minor pseudopilin GspK n=1 Tax=Thalassotalea aquiviva TaxID=3242415 RepID=UPI00352A307C
MIRAAQKGVALITVLLVVALAVVFATKMNSALLLQLQRVENINSNQQAYWYAMGAEAFAKTVLTLSFQDSSDKNVTHLGQIWASGQSSFPVDLGEISGEISDLQSCLNLNALVQSEQTKAESYSTGSGNSQTNADDKASDTGDESSQTNNEQSGEKNLPKMALKELIILLEVEGITSFEAESMADSLYDWLDGDSIISGSGGAEDNDYAAKLHPYLAANSKLASVGELRVIEHFTPAVINALKDYVCVLPNSDIHKININTIDPEKPILLQALLGGIDKSQAQDILSERGDSGFEKIEDFYSLTQVKEIKDFNQFRQQFVVDSEYFKLKTTTSFNNSFFSMSSVMKINTDQSISVINRSIGAD